MVSLVGDSTAEQVLAGKKFYSNSMMLQTGTMANHSNTTQSAMVTTNGNTGTVSIPAQGYYDTGSKLTIDLSSNNSGWYEKGKKDAEGFVYFQSIDLSGLGARNIKTVEIDCTGLQNYDQYASSDFLIVPKKVYERNVGLEEVHEIGVPSCSYSNGMLTVSNSYPDGQMLDMWYSMMDIYINYK